MNTTELAALRKLIDEAISKQLPATEQQMARAVTNVITGIAFDLGRAADALEAIANKATD
jgi:hypothetical protein